MEVPGWQGDRTCRLAPFLWMGRVFCSLLYMHRNHEKILMAHRVVTCCSLLCRQTSGLHRKGLPVLGSGAGRRDKFGGHLESELGDGSGHKHSTSIGRALKPPADLSPRQALANVQFHGPLLVGRQAPERPFELGFPVRTR